MTTKEALVVRITNTYVQGEKVDQSRYTASTGLGHAPLKQVPLKGQGPTLAQGSEDLENIWAMLPTLPTTASTRPCERASLICTDRGTKHDATRNVRNDVGTSSSNDMRKGIDTETLRRQCVLAQQEKQRWQTLTREPTLAVNNAATSPPTGNTTDTVTGVTRSAPTMVRASAPNTSLT